MRKIIPLALLALASFSCGGTDETTQEPLSADTIVRHADFASEFIAKRHVDVWLPPGYFQSQEKFPVLYMHDGQNIFEPGFSYGGQEWAIDETMKRLIEEKKVRPAVVVGVWNSDKRFQEYMPMAYFERMDSAYQDTIRNERGLPLSDEYLKFFTQELMPFIEKEYKVLTGPENTFVMGSSMGGLISSYLLAKHPDRFGGAGCVSTHWPVSLKHNLPGIADGYQAYLAEAFRPENKVYFDYGTATLDAWYEPHQLHMDSLMRAASFRENENWMSRKYEGAEHNEAAWRARVDIPLQFLLAP